MDMHVLVFWSRAALAFRAHSFAPGACSSLLEQTTDGFSGLNGGWDTAGSGHNLLVHNMCRLEGAAGTWMVVAGGMGTVTQRLATAAMQAGAKIHTGRPVDRWAGCGRSVGSAQAGIALQPTQLLLSI